VLTAVDTRAQYRQLAEIYGPVALAVFVVVVLLLAWVIWRGCRRARASTRSQNLPLELTYVLGLVVVAGVLLAFTYGTESRVDAQDGRAAVQVGVLAARWNWRFDYPQDHISIRGTDTRPPTLVVPRGQAVAFAGSSVDVVHAFWIPDLDFQRQLFAGRTTRWQLTFTSTSSGTSGLCSFFCGLLHQRMVFFVRVLDPAAFRQWVASGGRT